MTVPPEAGDLRSGRLRRWIPSPPVLLILLLLSIATNVLFALRLHGISPVAARSLLTPAVPAIRPGDRILGDAAKGVPVIVYSDFQCPFSARLHESLRALQGEVDVAYVFRNFPLKGHPRAATAAEAAECAGDQGRFWEYADALFAFQDDLSDAALDRIATDLGLDLKTFDACLASGTHRGDVAAQAAEGARLGIAGTPTLFIRGRRFDEALPYPVLRRELLDAGGTGTQTQCE